ncbi:MAG: hypothetical protein LBG52_04725 [Candidatus Peribacteria bacterium]|nr:hypothetical protein [Candidatus Peribacteria bacterium]
MHLCKRYGITLINVFDDHPEGHVLFAANYKNKKPYDTITYNEVSQWTSKNNGIGERAEFKLSELKRFLQQRPNQQETLRPDHCLHATQGVQLTEPLKREDFTIHIPKGTWYTSAGYSGFDDTY